MIIANLLPLVFCAQYHFTRLIAPGRSVTREETSLEVLGDASQTPQIAAEPFLPNLRPHHNKHLSLPRVSKLSMIFTNTYNHECHSN